MEFFTKQLEFRQTRGLFIRLISKVLLKNTQILPLFGKNFETSIKTQKCCSCQRFNPKIPGFTMKNRKKTLQRAQKIDLPPTSLLNCILFFASDACRSLGFPKFSGTFDFQEFLIFLRFSCFCRFFLVFFRPFLFLGFLVNF